MYATGLYLSSDRRFKADFERLSDALESLGRLEGLRYARRSGDNPEASVVREEIGVVAQDVEQVFPALVKTDADGYKAVNYAGLIPVVIEAVKELSATSRAAESRADARVRAGRAPEPTGAAPAHAGSAPERARGGVGPPSATFLAPQRQGGLHFGLHRRGDKLR